MRPLYNSIAITLFMIFFIGCGSESSSDSGLPVNPDDVSLAAPSVYYSYDADFDHASVLSQNTVLENQEVYFFVEAENATSVTFQCCDKAGFAQTTTSSADIDSHFAVSFDFSSVSLPGDARLEVNYITAESASAVFASSFSLEITTVIVDTYANISWQAPTQRTDTSPLNAAEIAEYRIVYTKPSGDVAVEVVSGQLNTFSLLADEVGDYEFYMITIDSDGSESSRTSLQAFNI